MNEGKVTLITYNITLRLDTCISGLSAKLSEEIISIPCAAALSWKSAVGYWNVENIKSYWNKFKQIRQVEILMYIIITGSKHEVSNCTIQNPTHKKTNR